MLKSHITYMGGCQNYGPFLGTLNIRGRIITGTPKGTIILTTTHIHIHICAVPPRKPTLYLNRAQARYLILEKLQEIRHFVREGVG